MPCVAKVAGVLVVAWIMTTSQAGFSQPSGGFAPPLSGGLASPPAADSFGHDQFESLSDGNDELSASETRRQRSIAELSIITTLEEIIERPTTLFVGGILRSPNDNNIGGTNNP